MSDTTIQNTSTKPDPDMPRWAPAALSIMVVVASCSFVIALASFVERTTI